MRPWDGSSGSLKSPVSAHQCRYCWSIVKCSSSLPSPHRQPHTIYIRLDACMSHLSWLAARPPLLLLRVTKGVWISTYYASLSSATYAPDRSRWYAPMQLEFSSIVIHYPYPSIPSTALVPSHFMCHLYMLSRSTHGGVVLFDVRDWFRLIGLLPTVALPHLLFLQPSSTTGAACLRTCVLRFVISSADILCCECSEHAVSSRPRRREGGKM